MKYFIKIQAFLFVVKRITAKEFSYKNPKKMNKHLVIIYTILFCFISSSSFAQTKEGWESLTLREKIGQIAVMFHDPAEHKILGNGSIENYFKKYPVAAFWTGWKNLVGTTEKTKSSIMHQTIEDYKKMSKFPVLFMEDFEQGIGDRFDRMTQMPPLMALSACKSSNFAYRYGRTIALESRSLGMNMLAHPVVDLTLNPLNPITNIRCTGDNPDMAIKLLSQQIKAMQSLGIAATIKHFPGDGVDFRDQHMLTSCNSLSKKDWKKNHGKVFKALIDSGVYCIMPGHISLPVYQTPNADGLYLPATLSKELLTDLLKKEMGFKGVILSDAMVMGGFRGWYKNNLECEIQTFLAGTDLLLWPSYEFIDTLEARINKGIIPIERLNDAVSRVWNLKKKLGLFNKDYQQFRTLSDEDKKYCKESQKMICEKSITLVKDRFNVLPLNKERDKKILVVGTVPVLTKGGTSALESTKLTADLLRMEGYNVDFQHNLLYENDGWKETITSQYDKIIFVFATSPHTPLGTLQLFDDQAQTIWGINSMPQDKIIIISLGNPFLYAQYFERCNVYINSYSSSNPIQEALIKALTGVIPFQGASPVKLAGRMKFMLE